MKRLYDFDTQQKSDKKKKEMKSENEDRTSGKLPNLEWMKKQKKYLKLDERYFKHADPIITVQQLFDRLGIKSEDEWITIEQANDAFKDIRQRTPAWYFSRSMKRITVTGKKKLKTIIGSSSLSGYLGLWTHHAAQYFKGAKKDKKGEEIQMGTNTDFIAAIRGTPKVFDRQQRIRMKWGELNEDDALAELIQFYEDEEFYETGSYLVPVIDPEEVERKKKARQEKEKTREKQEQSKKSQVRDKPLVRVVDPDVIDLSLEDDDDFPKIVKEDANGSDSEEDDDDEPSILIYVSPDARTVNRYTGRRGNIELKCPAPFSIAKNGNASFWDNGPYENWPYYYVTQDLFQKLALGVLDGKFGIYTPTMKTKVLGTQRNDRLATLTMQAIIFANKTYNLENKTIPGDHRSPFSKFAGYEEMLYEIKRNVNGIVETDWIDNHPSWTEPGYEYMWFDDENGKDLRELYPDLVFGKSIEEVPEFEVKKGQGSQQKRLEEFVIEE